MNAPYGDNLKLFISGGSHDDKIFMRLSGFPAGVKIDTQRLYAFLSRRAPGNNAWSTSRREADIPVFTAGLCGNITTGGEIEAYIENTSRRSSDYSFSDTPRPSHADYAAVKKYGSDVDLRGGGHFSGRLTALSCLAGGLCMDFLRPRGIDIFAHIFSVGSIRDIPFDMASPGEKEAVSGDFPVLSPASGEKMKELILSAKERGNSVGGVVECAATGLPAGLGEHMFSSAEARIASAVFSIPGVKGIEFGSGFHGSGLFGSENNDPFYTDGKGIYTRTNNCGGILGGMTDGMPVIFRAALKPTPSIALEQSTVSISKMENVRLKISGRHDPCIVPRAVPVLEAAAALAITDMLLDE